MFDSQYPIGGFAHSSGLETYAQLDRDKEDLAALLKAQLSLGRLDLAACCLAFQAPSHRDLEDLCAELDAWKPIPGLKSTSLKLGKRQLSLAKRLYPEMKDFALEKPHYAVVIGVLGKRLKLELEPLLLGFVQAMLFSSLAAATRCMPLSPEQAQEIMLSLHVDVEQAVKQVLTGPKSQLFSATLALDVRAHQQAYLYTRLFQS